MSDRLGVGLRGSLARSLAVPGRASASARALYDACSGLRDIKRGVAELVGRWPHGWRDSFPVSEIHAIFRETVGIP